MIELRSGHASGCGELLHDEVFEGLGRREKSSRVLIWSVDYAATSVGSSITSRFLKTAGVAHDGVGVAGGSFGNAVDD
jgi:hypothetical protein